jgi:hypothetical protein
LSLLKGDETAILFTNTRAKRKTRIPTLTKRPFYETIREKKKQLEPPELRVATNARLVRFQLLSRTTEESNKGTGDAAAQYEVQYVAFSVTVAT